MFCVNNNSMKKSLEKFKNIKIIDIIMKKYKAFKTFDDKYKISLYSTSISFYMIIASISLLNIMLGIIGKYLESVDSYLLSKIIEVFEYLEYYKYFSFNTGSLIFVIGIIWSSSKVINGYNKVSDFIYGNNKKRNSWYLRISAFIMFLFMIVILMLELMLSVFFQKVLEYIIFNIYLFRIIEFIIEILLIYIIIVILYIYVPPKFMSYKEVKKGALISASLLYLILVLLVFVYSFIGKYFNKVNINNSIILLISSYLLALFVFNYVIILGLIINSKNYKLLNNNKSK